MPGKRKSVFYAAAGGVVFRGDEVLVLRRPSRGEVRLPKGHLEDGETAEQAALREVAEETGFCDLALGASLGTILNRFLYDGLEVRRMETYFLMTVVSAATRPRSNKEEREFTVDWVPQDDAVEALTFETEKEFVRRAITARGKPEGGAA